jgi:hypothetical protein
MTATPLPQKWGEMLAHVEQALTAAIQAVERREQALRDQPPVSGPGPATDLDAGLARFREHLQALSGCSGRAEQTVAAADADLAAGEEALRDWFQAAEAARRKLADWASRP